MRALAIRRWLLAAASGGFLLFVGCPDTAQFEGVITGSIQTFVANVLGVFISHAIEGAFTA